MGGMLFQLHGKGVWTLNSVRNLEILGSEILKVILISDLYGVIHS